MESSGYHGDENGLTVAISTESRILEPVSHLVPGALAVVRGLMGPPAQAANADRERAQLLAGLLPLVQTSKVTPGLPTPTVSLTVASTHLVGRPFCLPFMAESP